MVAYHQRAASNRSDQQSARPLCALSPGVRSRRPSLKCGQVPPFVADNAAPRAQEEAGQDDPFNPSLRGRNPELVSLAHTTMGGQQGHLKSTLLPQRRIRFVASILLNHQTNHACLLR